MRQRSDRGGTFLAAALLASSLATQTGCALVSKPDAPEPGKTIYSQKPIPIPANAIPAGRGAGVPCASG